MSSLSPVDTTLETSQQQRSGSGYASGESSSAKSPLAMSLGFLKGLTDRKTTRDGQPPKRRGPKPDSKPALTRRQELNRQAQRTHRERKEIYIKALEEQVMQLKETYTGAVQERLAVIDENRKLKELLRIHNIAYTSPENGTSAAPAAPYHGGNSSDSRSASYPYNQTFSPPRLPTSGSVSPSTSAAAHAGSELIGGPQSTFDPHYQGGGMDHDQLGVDFVLALERPCMAHLQYMCVRSNQEAEPSPNGHALMASCPPFSHIDRHPEEPYPHKVPDLPKADLFKLLNLSASLPLDGELTPVMALNMIRTHERYGELTEHDFNALRVDLQTKTRCYGFGAVLEEFEVRDVLSSLLATKPESYARFTYV
ncbi:hypothetical protein MMC34_000062 [Xylographa carneopallida]|nr:hypothetical protein [Xylographa carneopallida]